MSKKLTIFEKEIMMMLIEGRNYKFIMEWFDLSYKEYKLAKSNIFKKLNIKRSSELFKIAIELKLLNK
ncbi:MAG: hypothetical protein BHW64_03190 [Candidatus Melainabacteria bacterium LEY3_CP_29_8]|nr:MAG: hypothetical protein BHW64_03190 [Candidatus Melainabacteria bacterium LEY3_CP_29_8]